MKRVDLHTHSRHSDGTLPPAELVAKALKAGVDVFFLTDHDSVSGFPEAEEAGRGSPLKLYCGIEINTSESDSVHLLGYGFRRRDAKFSERLAEFRSRRAIRAARIVENLRGLGLDISLDDVKAQSHETLGRPHVADALKRKGIVSTRQEAFNRFLIRGKPGYVEPMGPSPEEAISLIREAGGFTSLAHPETIKDLSSRLKDWIAQGLEGLEVYYANHSAGQTERFRGLAAFYGLIATGGSDYHGPGSGREVPLGVDVPNEVYDRFMERLARCS